MFALKEVCSIPVKFLPCLQHFPSAFWLIWDIVQRACKITICLSSVIIFIIMHCCSSSSSAYVSSSPGHMANHRDIIFGKCIYEYDAHQILGQWDVYFKNGSIFNFLTLLSFLSEVTFRGRPNLCTLLYLSTVNTSPNTFRSQTYIQNLAALSVFDDKFNKFGS